MEKVKAAGGKIKEKATANRKAVAVSAACIAALLAIALASLAMCGACTPKTDDSTSDKTGRALAESKTSASKDEVENGTEDEAESDQCTGGVENVEDGAGADDGAAASNSPNAASSCAAPPSASTSAGSASASLKDSNTGSTGSASSTSVPATSEPERHWVEDTESVWVEDAAAWSEDVPVYGTVEVSVCNVCGADITGNTAAHAKAHMLLGEGSGHHSETRQVITGYETVTHAAAGHWEIRVVGGHWE